MTDPDCERAQQGLACATAGAYNMGCRKELCRLANNASARKRYAANKVNIHFKRAPVDNARRHLNFLADNGVIMNRVAERVFVNYNTITKIRHHNKYIGKDLEQAILALGINDLELKKKKVANASNHF